jgi:hypothetical protein
LGAQNGPKGRREDKKQVIAAANLNDPIAARARLHEQIKAGGLAN